MLSSVIIEDLMVAAKYLRQCCVKCGKVEVKAHFFTVKEAIDFLHENTVDLLFLDVELQDENGFSIFDRLIYFPQVILTTVGSPGTELEFAL